MRRFLPTLVLTLILAAPAQADTFDVVGRGDSGGGCSAIGPQSWQCVTLRDAVAAASQTAGEADGILLHAGSPYVLSAGQLLLSSDVVIIGEGPRTTTLQAGTAARVATVGGTAQVALFNVTVQGGAPSGDGGNIATGAGTILTLSNARVTGGTAQEGGGITNGGTLEILNSLIDNNTATTGGGGILNQGTSGDAAALSAVNTTIAFNRVLDGPGAGIQSEGNTGNDVLLSFATVARNFGNGLSVSGPQTVDVSASIFAANGLNCSGVSFANAQFNLDDGTSCGFSSANNRVQTQPQLAETLSNQGGPTDVLTFPASSPVVDYVTPCFFPSDQRGYIRVTDPTTQPCDIGAFELSGTAPTEQPPPPPPPTPTPTPVPPQPTPTPTPEPTPVPNSSVAAEEVKGTVLIKVNGKFVAFEEGLLKNGAEVDTRKGTVEITTAQGDKAQFFDGIFKLSQKGGVTTLTLSEALNCKKAKSRASAAASKPKTRKLWGDGKGKFRTKGTYSAATVRGTKWLVQDTCTTTTTKVTQGAVTVDDLVKKIKKVLRKGKTYVARKKN